MTLEEWHATCLDLRMSQIGGMAIIAQHLISIMRAAEDEILYARRRDYHEHVIEQLERMVAIAEEPLPLIHGSGANDRDNGTR